MAGWHHDNAVWAKKSCTGCGSSFTPKSGSNTFCNKDCYRKHKRTHGTGRTDAQYMYVSGDWSRYFSRLCNQKHRRGQITRDDCLRILERQNYKCALSGERLTCTLASGVRTMTNASLDRIEAGGSYSPDNVQLVCVALNWFRRSTSVPEFIDWCRKVARHVEETA